MRTIYYQIAEAIKSHADTSIDPASFRSLVNELTDLIENDDVDFDRDKFIDCAWPKEDHRSKTRYYIWSHEHNAWWRPNESGYTTKLEEAGTYSFARAAQITIGHVPTGEEVAVAEYDARYFPEQVARRREVLHAAGLDAR